MAWVVVRKGMGGQAAYGPCSNFLTDIAKESGKSLCVCDLDAGKDPTAMY